MSESDVGIAEVKTRQKVGSDRYKALTSRPLNGAGGPVKGASRHDASLNDLGRGERQLREALA
jgi:hypothetical protein